MDVKSTILFAACIAASVSSLGETAYSYDENDAKIYIATVPAGETNAITEAAAGVLNAIQPPESPYPSRGWIAVRWHRGAGCW